MLTGVLLCSSVAHQLLLWASQWELWNGLVWSGLILALSSCVAAGNSPNLSGPIPSPENGVNAHVIRLFVLVACLAMSSTHEAPAVVPPSPLYAHSIPSWKPTAAGALSVL